MFIVPPIGSVAYIDLDQYRPDHAARMMVAAAAGQEPPKSEPRPNARLYHHTLDLTTVALTDAMEDLSPLDALDLFDGFKGKVVFDTAHPAPQDPGPAHRLAGEPVNPLGVFTDLFNLALATRIVRLATDRRWITKPEMLRQTFEQLGQAGLDPVAMIENPLEPLDQAVVTCLAIRAGIIAAGAAEAAEKVAAAAMEEQGDDPNDPALRFIKKHKNKSPFPSLIALQGADPEIRPDPTQGDAAAKRAFLTAFQAEILDDPELVEKTFGVIATQAAKFPWE